MGVGRERRTDGEIRRHPDRCRAVRNHGLKQSEKYAICTSAS